MVNIPLPKVGLIAATCVVAIVFSTVLVLIQYAPGLHVMEVLSDPYYCHITAFSLYQAFLSMLLSVGLAIPVAHALSRRQFFGKSLLLKICASTLVMPVLVGVFGLLAILGNSGLVAQLFSSFDLKLPFSIYGLNGILIAHVFFNLPYATRLLLNALESIPAEQHYLTSHLGMTSWQKFKWVEWPRIWQVLPQISGLVFMLCFTSFTTVMALGGGPKSTTIELAIYQAIKFDFDLTSGAMLALWQMLLCGGISLILLTLSKAVPASSMVTLQFVACGRGGKKAVYWDVFWIALIVLLVFPPLLMVILQGVNPSAFWVLQDVKFWLALKSSIQIAVLASVLALVLGVCILLSSRALTLLGRIKLSAGLELSASMILVTPGIVLSTGLFLLLRDHLDVMEEALWIVVLVNSLMALPYVIKTLSQPMLQSAQHYEFLCQSLGIKGWNRFKVVEWRALNKPIAHAFSISFLFSMGDLSAIALFGSQSLTTLPLYLFQLLGSYQMSAAAVVSLCLLVFSVICFLVVEYVFKRGSQHV